jgi:hypothetical protein
LGKGLTSLSDILCVVEDDCENERVMNESGGRVFADRHGVIERVSMEKKEVSDFAVCDVVCNVKNFNARALVLCTCVNGVIGEDEFTFFFGGEVELD